LLIFVISPLGITGLAIFGLNRILEVVIKSLINLGCPLDPAEISLIETKTTHLNLTFWMRLKGGEQHENFTHDCLDISNNRRLGLADSRPV
jgi:hypothetical protein